MKIARLQNWSKTGWIYYIEGNSGRGELLSYKNSHMIVLGNNIPDLFKYEPKMVKFVFNQNNLSKQFEYVLEFDDLDNFKEKNPEYFV